MELTVKETIEHEDGSATLMIDMDDETKRWLINKAIIDCIKQGLVEVEALHDNMGGDETSSDKPLEHR